MHDYKQPDMTQGGTVAIPLDPPLQGDHGSGVSNSMNLKHENIHIPDPPQYALTEITQLDVSGRVMCAPDAWHNYMAFTGLTTLLIVVFLALTAKSWPQNWRK